MSELVPTSETGHLDQGRICLKVNGEVKQDGDLSQMIWKVPEMIAYLSRFYDISGGDLIMSGTPAGVGIFNSGSRRLIGLGSAGLFKKGSRSLVGPGSGSFFILIFIEKLKKSKFKLEEPVHLHLLQK